MEEIKIPSPSAILDTPSATTTNSSPTGPTKPAPKRSTQAPAKSTTSAATTNNPAGVNKPKLSKSRNGCITCKTKRLKCDETKPTCQQCQKRNVTCGGYKKDFKWRPFEEANFANKSNSKSKKAIPSPPLPAAKQVNQSSASGLNRPIPDKPRLAVEGDVPRTQETFSHPNGLPTPNDCDSQENPFFDDMRPFSGEPMLVSPIDPQSPGRNINHEGRAGLTDRGQTGGSARENQASSHQSPMTNLTDRLELSPNRARNLADFMGNDESSSGIPVDLSSFDMADDALSFEPDDGTFSSLLDGDNDEIIEMVRQTEPGSEPWLIRVPSPNPSNSSRSSECSMNMLFRDPTFGMGSPEMLMLRFERQTCGILSVKDGRLENPWRTAIWPLAKESPALYHAISSLTAFHSSKERPDLRVQGMDHMRRSIRALAAGIGSMRTDVALATTLTLAFAESWDQHISTGIQHLRGAKVLVNQAIANSQQNTLGAEELARLRFLQNTWVYMDVIARLTSLEEDPNDDPTPTPAPFSAPRNTVQEVDPLMGCATTLFPLIGRVATLVSRVRNSECNSIAIVSQAIELKMSIEQWEPPQYFDPPEDPTSDVQHSFQTAQAYRWATLLYLHQAVPEIPSETASTLARRVLVFLATIPLSSRTLVVHIYPLLAASCEVDNEEDRAWVRDRWGAMQARLMIGNIDRCLEVIKEVWDRRDAFETEMMRNNRRPARSKSFAAPVDTMKSTSDGSAIAEETDDLLGIHEPSGSQARRSGSGVAGDISAMRVSHGRRGSVVPTLENIEFEKTVRGSLHWVGVMRDWKWEGDDNDPEPVGDDTTTAIVVVRFAV
ncbi:hypothetical protein FQN54_008781 [Arachnomyces sp. PD_36]|nr:hypothetical protein FQN54_008781 [Arachnomyces sp. PD_36]